MTSKLALCGAVMILGAMTGRSFAGADARRARLLAELMDALQMLRIHVLDRLMPLDAALSSSKSALLAKLGEIAGKTGAGEAWSTIKQKEMHRGGMIDCLTSQDIKVLDNLFSMLGITGRDEQRPIIDAAIRDLGLLENEARCNSGDKNRLFTILGALTGTAVVIFIL